MSASGYGEAVRHHSYSAISSSPTGPGGLGGGEQIVQGPGR